MPTRPTSQPSSARRGASAAVLRAVLEHGPVARSTIARLTGLSPASVTGQVCELAELGLIRERSEVVKPHSVGRPHVPIDIDTSRHLACGLHIAVRHATVALLDLRGAVVAQRQIPHDGAGPLMVLQRAVNVLDDLLDELAAEANPIGLGVATGGWVDQHSGMLVEHPLLGWRDVPVRRLLASATGLRVHVDSHSRALVHAERLFGRTRGRGSVLSLFIGNVVDAAFATGDLVHHGPRSQAGTIAHLPVPGNTHRCSCGRVGCLQAAVSEQTVVREAIARGIASEPSVMAVLDATRGGNTEALGLLVDRARLIGRAVALLLDFLNPEVVVVVEPGVAHLPECLAELRAEVRSRSWVLRDPEQSVFSTSFADTVLATAAGAVLLDLLYRDPVTLQLRRVSHAS